MGIDPLIQLVLGDEALTRGLGDAEARVLVEWLVERAEELAGTTAADGELRKLCRRGRAVARFVALWGQRRGRGAACQLAASERFGWPLPEGDVEPCELMQSILHWEACELERRAA
jgi:hypothetical protein